MDASPGRGDGAEVRSRARWSLRLLRGWRPRGAELRRLAVTLVLGWLTMLLTIAIMPGVQAGLAVDVLVTTVALAILSAALRPVLTSLALLLGWAGVLLAGLVVQALLFYAALLVSPGIEVDGFWDA